MNLTAEEKLMYEVMKSVYDSGIPINFKGSMVLKACLLEAGYDEEIRHTVDIGANWNSDTQPTAEQMVDSLSNAMKQAGIDLNVKLYRMYGEGRSAGFELADKTTGEIIFTMDIDVNRPEAITKIYEIEDIRFRGVAPTQMIADKVSVVSSDKVFRRIKDVIDLYYFAKAFDFKSAEILKTISDSGRVLGDFNGFLNRTDELRHSYDKFRFSGNVAKPTFDEVYQTVRSYISGVIAV